MSYPNDRRYTEEHEWARKDGELITVGITDHAQSSLGDVVYVELPEAGRELKAKDTFGVVESIKAVSDLFSPISGTVAEVNEGVKSEPGSLNQDPHGNAWLLKIKPANAGELEKLMDASAYETFIKNQG